jgi:3-hydroxyisobutyrate dehydrogenase
MTGSPRIAFLGLGIMGSGMAHRLLSAGFEVSVFNRNTEKTRSHAAAGAKAAATPREAASGANIVLSMVADDVAARAVWLGPQGALGALAPGGVAIESSTITPEWARELAAHCAEAGIEFLDAPVTGSRDQAAAGELNFLVGGAASTLERVRPVLSAMGRKITLLGPAGSGAVVKLINNFLCSTQVVALAEAVTMIERCGLDRAGALEVITHGAPGSPLVKAISARMTEPPAAPHFALRLMAKDLDYALRTAAAQSLELRTARTARGIFDAALAAGLGDRDFSAVIEPLRAR